MSLAEIKEQVVHLSPDERSELIGYLKLVTLQSDPSRADRLAQRMARMDAGYKTDEAGLLKRLPGLRTDVR